MSSGSSHKKGVFERKRTCQHYPRLTFPHEFWRYFTAEMADGLSPKTRGKIALAWSLCWASFSAQLILFFQGLTNLIPSQKILCLVELWIRDQAHRSNRSLNFLLSPSHRTRHSLRKKPQKCVCSRPERSNGGSTVFAPRVQQVHDANRLRNFLLVFYSS